MESQVKNHYKKRSSSCLKSIAALYIERGEEMVEGKFITGKKQFEEIYEIRKKVFCEEQEIPEELEFDLLDEEAIHVLIKEKEKSVATARLIRIGEQYRIGRVAVLKEERGNYYGDFAVRMLADRAFQMGADEILISAQIKAIPFYEKIGFQRYGDSYYEDGIVHIGMKLKKHGLCSCCKGHNRIHG